MLYNIGIEVEKSQVKSQKSKISTSKRASVIDKAGAADYREDSFPTGP